MLSILLKLVQTHLILAVASVVGILFHDAYIDELGARLWKKGLLLEEEGDGYESNSDPACAKSCTGFLITVSDCPMVWVSELQTETALSTMEAEVNALAHCCRELFPVIDIVSEIGKTVGLDTEDMVSMHVSIHEDNAGALVLAETLPPQFNV